MRRIALIGLLLFVAASPALALEDYRDVTLHSGATADGDGTTIRTTGYNTVRVDVAITNTATVTFKGYSADGTFRNIRCENTATGDIAATATASGNYQCPVYGMVYVKAPISNCSSCTVSVAGRMTTALSAGMSSGSAGGGITTDIEDGAGDSVMDAGNNAMRVNIIAGAGSGGTAMTDDAAFTAGTTSVTPVGAMFDDTSPDSVDEGDGGVLRMSANRNLYTTLRDAAGNERGANVNASNELLTSSNTELPAAAALADNTANPTVPGVAAFLMCYDGSTWDRCQGGLTDTDDGTVAGAQVPSLSLNLNYVYDGSNWVRKRLHVGIEDAAETDGIGLAMAGAVRRDTAASSAGTTGDNATINVDALGQLWTRNLDPCSGTAKTYLPISISTATTTEITPSLAGASTHYYVCSLNLITAAANNVLVADDDSDNCGSPTSGIFGSDGSPAAGEGWNFAANGGIAIGSGMSSVGRTGGTNRVICIITSAATQLSGMMTVVAAP